MISSARDAEQIDRVEHTQRLDALLASTSDAIIELDGEGDVLFANRAAGALLPDLRVGGHWLVGWPSAARASAEQAFASALHGTPVVCASSRPGALGKGAWIEYRLAPMLRAGAASGAATGVALVARDITAEKHAEAQRLVRDRLSSLGALAATISHEINNPLAVLMMGFDLIKRDLDDKRSNRSAASLRDELDDMREAANRTRQVVADLRIFSRPDDERSARVEVRTVLASVVRLLRTGIRQRARLIESYGEVPPVEASEGKLGQLFLQLLLNAAQAIPDGDADGNELRVETAVDPNGRVLVAISDTGAGIASEQHAQVLDPFFTTKAGNAHGIGLSLCAQLVADLGGTLSFESEPGKGSVFRVALPPAARGVSPVPLHHSPRPSPRRARVLVVDDESMVVSVVARFLGTDHEIVPALAARQALELINREPSFDVILCDLMMPHMTGMELHAQLLRSHPEQAKRMVFMTAGAFTPRARAFLDSVPNPRLEKPFDPQSLRALIERLAQE